MTTNIPFMFHLWQIRKSSPGVPYTENIVQTTNCNLHFRKKKQDVHERDFEKDQITGRYIFNVILPDNKNLQNSHVHELVLKLWNFSRKLFTRLLSDTFPEVRTAGFVGQSRPSWRRWSPSWSLLVSLVIRDT